MQLIFSRAKSTHLLHYTDTRLKVTRYLSRVCSRFPGNFTSGDFMGEENVLFEKCPNSSFLGPRGPIAGRKVGYTFLLAQLPKQNCSCQREKLLRYSTSNTLTRVTIPTDRKAERGFETGPPAAAHACEASTTRLGSAAAMNDAETEGGG